MKAYVKQLATVTALLLLRGASANVLLIRFGAAATAKQIEVNIATWNEQLQDGGTNFRGDVYHEPQNPGGCGPLSDAVSGHIVLLTLSAACNAAPGATALTTSAAAERGALGAIFYDDAGTGIPDGGLVLGHSPRPPVQAFAIERLHGEEIASELAKGMRVSVEWGSGLVLAEDAYDETFILREDELASTRAATFAWRVLPEMLRSSGSETLSSRLMRRLQVGSSLPEGWFRAKPSFVPLFNPSIVALSEQLLLVSLRVSNGPGCPSLRNLRDSSLETRALHNELLLALVAASDLEILAHTIVQMPSPLLCNFTEVGSTGNRQFLDIVQGPMDARLQKGADGEIWVAFYAERNDGPTLHRGMYAAPLKTSFTGCAQSGAAPKAGVDGSEQTDPPPPEVAWRPLPRGKVLGGHTCSWLAHADAESPGNCKALCTMKSQCNAINYGTYCVLLKCQSLGADLDLRILPEPWGEWQAWLMVPSSAAGEECSLAAWVEEGELIQFPLLNDENKVEKNWNLFHFERDTFLIEYFVEPHIVMKAYLHRGGEEEEEAAAAPGVALRGLTQESSVTRWPGEVLNMVSNVRGGFCCVELAAALWQAGLPGLLSIEQPPAMEAPLLLGSAHLQRIRSPNDNAVGDQRRFLRQSKTRTYFHIFYLLRAEKPFDAVAVSTEWCITLAGNFSKKWGDELQHGEKACEAVQFVSGLALRQSPAVQSGGDDSKELLIAYGINDCEADLHVMPLQQLFSLLRPVSSLLDFSFDGDI